MKNLFNCFFLLIFISGSAQFTNIKLPIPKKATYFYSQVEPSIYINPNNVNEVIAGSVLTSAQVCCVDACMHGLRAGTSFV